MSWSARYFSASRTPDTLDTFDTMAGAASPPAKVSHSVNSVRPAEKGRSDPDDAAYAAAERAAIMAEPRLPALGTPARGRLDRAHKQMVAGLMRAANAGE